MTSRVKISGGEALARMLDLADVGPVFGMGGFQLLPFYEALRGSGREHVLVNDERAGAFAADAYARITGRPGVCDATLGPGATNLVTGLVESLNAGIPMIAIAGDSHRSHAGKNMTQEGPQAALLSAASKDFLRVEDQSRIPELVRRAFRIATSGRPGPVVIDMPEDIAHQEFAYDEGDLFIDESLTSVPSLRTRPDPGAIERAASMLAAASRPVILAGGGVHLSNAGGELEKLADSRRIPVAHTLTGKGAIACTHGLSVGLFGRFSRFANDLIESSDCLLVVGCKLGEIATKRYAFPAPSTPLIHLDMLAEEIGRWAPATVGLWGDAALGLSDLNAALDALPAPKSAARDEYVAEINARRSSWAESATARYQSGERPIAIARIIHELNRLMPEDGVLITDGGFASHWGGLLYDTKSRGRRFIANRGFASIGYGLPAAVGGSLALRDRKDAPVVSITGDGGMNMSVGELETAARTNATFTLIVLNNAASGYVKALQHAVYGPGHYQSSDLREVDYAAVARHFGCEGVRIEGPADLSSALTASLSGTGAPTVLDVMVTRNPAEMLPGVDSRAIAATEGDRPL